MPKISVVQAGGHDVKAGIQLRAFLDMIAVSEIGCGLMEISNDGYNVIVGSTIKKPILFSDYSKHPEQHVKKMNSDAAGRYQFMGRYWEYYRDLLHLPDFGPLSQDRWALQLIHERHATSLVVDGQFEAAVQACRSIWASFPGAGYKNQHENSLGDLAAAFTKAGGFIKN